MPLYPYQKRWIEDQSRRKIADKSRRIGFSFAEGLEQVISRLKEKRGGMSKSMGIVLSRGERQAKEFITDSVAPHVRAIGVVAEYVDAYMPGTSILTHEVRFGGENHRIIALPANPDTARSYEGDVTLDEFAFHQNPGEIYAAIGPSITRGYRIKIISTPNGQQGTYYELANAAGLVDGMVRNTNWSSHVCTLAQAIAQGCRDRFGRVLDLATIRADCIDEDTWLQEYNCAFLSIGSQWIPPELFQSCVDASANDGYPVGEYRKTLYAGWDVARNRDLSVVWLLEMVGDVSVTRGVVEFSNMPTPEQKREARGLMRHCARMLIDKTGMGLSIYEDLAEEFPDRVEGVGFTQATKEEMAVHAKSRMQEKRVRIPDNDTIRHSFRSVKKTTSMTGQSRFDAAHDQQYGHADHFWAYCMAEEAAATTQGRLGLIDYFKQGAPGGFEVVGGPRDAPRPVGSPEQAAWWASEIERMRNGWHS